MPQKHSGGEERCGAFRKQSAKKKPNQKGIQEMQEKIFPMITRRRKSPKMIIQGKRKGNQRAIGVLRQTGLWRGAAMRIRKKSRNIQTTNAIILRHIPPVVVNKAGMTDGKVEEKRKSEQETDK